MLRATPLFMGAALLAGSSFAGTIEIVGRGEASSAPECATLSVNVVSLCYDKSTESKNANAELANSIIKALQKYKTSAKDAVTTSGATNSRQTEQVYVSRPNGTSETKILCERKWRATNTINLTTTNLKALPEIQDDILSLIDKAENVDTKKVAQTYAQLNSPNFAVHPETQKKLRKTAEQHAATDAREQLATFAEACKFKSAKLTFVGQPQYQSVPHYAAAAPESAGSASTPIMPDAIREHANWKFIWSFEGTDEKCTP